MRSSVTLVCLLVSSCAAPASGPASTPAVAKVEIESSPAETDTAPNDEPSIANDKIAPEQQGSSAPVPDVSTVKVVVSGTLPQSVVEQIVREGFDRFRMCYQRGLAQDPSVQGTVNA